MYPHTHIQLPYPDCSSSIFFIKNMTSTDVKLEVKIPNNDVMPNVLAAKKHTFFRMNDVSKETCMTPVIYYNDTHAIYTLTIKPDLGTVYNMFIYRDIVILGDKIVGKIVRKKLLKPIPIYRVVDEQ